MNKKEITITQILGKLKESYMRHLNNNEWDKAYSQCLQDMSAKLEQLKTRLADAISIYKAGNITEFDRGVIFALEKVLGDEE